MLKEQYVSVGRKVVGVVTGGVLAIGVIVFFVGNVSQQA